MRGRTFYWLSVSSELWRDEKVLFELSDHGKLVWTYLLTGHHMMNFPLAFSATLESMVSMSNISPRAFRRGMKEVVALGMAKVDWRRRVVLLPNAFKHHPTASGVTQGLSSKTVKGWIARLSQLPACELRNEAILTTIDTAVTRRPQVQDKKEGVWFDQALETLRSMLEGASKGLRSTLSTTRRNKAPHAIAAASAVPVSAPEMAAAVAERQGEPKVISTAAAAVSSSVALLDIKGGLSLTKAHTEFLGEWNRLRAERKMSQERLTASMLPRLELIWAAAAEQFPESALPAIGLMMRRFLDAKMAPDGDGTNTRTLSTLLSPKVWRERLDAACFIIHEREAEELLRRRRL